MNIKIKKIMLMAMLIVIVLSIIISILASPKTYAATTEDGSFEYSVQENYAKITKYLGDQSTVTIPSLIDGYSVTHIESMAFRDCSSVTKVIVPNSVTNIGLNAFQECSKLTSITLSDNIEEISYMMFQNCSSLENITIPDSVIRIKFCAFDGCSSLKQINISKNISFIDDSAFGGCTSLVSITVDNDNSKYTNNNNDGVLYNKEMTRIICYPAGKEGTTFTIPDGVTNINQYAFYTCSNLTQVNIPYSVTEIEGSSFAMCSNLTTITIPGSVTSIGDYTFHDCSNLTSVIIPDSVTKIGNIPFEKCSKLTITTKSNSTAHQHAINKSINVNLDDTKPSLQSPVYSLTQATQGNVDVTISADEPIQKIVSDNRTWNYVSTTNNNSIIATFTNNTTSEQLKIKDLVGNESTVTVNINNIDRTAPTATVTTDKSTYKAGETAIITATFSEAVRDTTPKISMSGISTLAETVMTKSSDIVYTYSYAIPNKSGTQTITISGASDAAGNVMNANSTKKFDITPIMTGIAITTEPNKTTYIEGQNFDSTGMKVTASYNDNTSQEVTDYTITDGSNLTVGKTNVTISYTENGVTKTATQDITVSEKKLTGISVTKVPDKTTYTEGQNFDKSGMIITATYDNGTTKEVTTYTITDGNNLTVEKTNVTISYTENGVTKTVTQAVTVNQKVLSSIRVSTVPSKTTYIEGQNFDSAGMKITASYNNNTSQEVTDYTITDGSNLTVGKTNVTISYTENGVTKTTTQDIIVSEKKLTGISVTKVPDKMTYTEGQNFDKSGMIIMATYDNGTKKEVTTYTITDGNNLMVGKTNVTISYTENGVTKTTTQAITVTKLETNFEGYNEVNTDGNKYICNINPSTTLGNILKKIKTNGKMTVYSNDNKETTDNNVKIASGMKLKISLNSENLEFTIVVKGDTDGDGESNLRDILSINKHRLNKALLKDEYLLAGDVNQDNQVDLKDVLQINKFRLGKINTL